MVEPLPELPIATFLGLNGETQVKKLLGDISGNIPNLQCFVPEDQLLLRKHGSVALQMGSPGDRPSHRRVLQNS